MAEYINKYANDAAIQAAVDNGELIKPYVAYDESANTIDWNTKFIDYASMPLTFEIMSNGSVSSWKNISNNMSIEYRINNGEWQTHTNNTTYNEVKICDVVTGDKVQFRGNNSAYGNSSYQAFKIRCSADFKIYGNIMSLVNSTGYTTATTVANFAFYQLFMPANTSHTYLKDISNLILPATTLGKYCYSNMFRDWTSISGSAPVLPATTLTEGCYERMFYKENNKRNNINYIKCLATNISASNCTYQMTGGMDSNVAPTGTFVTPSTTNWSTGVSGIPTNWTRVNSD